MQVGPLEPIRAQEATQIKHMDTQRAQHNQDQLGRNFQNMVQAEQRKPVEASKSEQKEYRYDAKEKGNNQYQGSGKNRQKKEKAKEQSEPVKKIPHNGRFDMRV
ncbi:hypothetical protein HNQ56_003175 [Anaerotaenia torta]|uniref:hypothetical protein n=1 Tax=Anaerotaenia torta TaxID=433293 RepID=UPI003D1B0C96